MARQAPLRQRSAARASRTAAMDLPVLAQAVAVVAAAHLLSVLLSHQVAAVVHHPTIQQEEAKLLPQAAGTARPASPQRAQVVAVVAIPMVHLHLPTQEDQEGREGRRQQTREATAAMPT